MESRQQLGRDGEAAVAAYMQRLGWSIVGRNWRPTGAPVRGEIDIIAREDKTLVFVEVRTRTSTLYGSPEESITRAKIEHLLAVADDFITGHPGLPDERRIDVIAVRLDPDGQLSSIDHLRKALEGR